MLYLEALAAREQQIRETRRRIEHDRLEARSARNRSGTEAAPRLPLPPRGRPRRARLVGTALAWGRVVIGTLL